MQNNTHEEKVDEREVDSTIVSGKGGDTSVAKKVYEIGYVLLSSIAKEKVAEQTALVNDVLAKAGATVLAHGDPELTPLAYTMVKKIHGSNQRFNEGYFGWVKFELPTEAIISVKKALDTTESILRYLLMTTVKENTYLGKRAPVYTAGVATRDAGMIVPEAQTVLSAETTGTTAEATKVGVDEVVSMPPSIPAATVEEMDKSIDDMVKDA